MLKKSLAILCLLILSAAFGVYFFLSKTYPNTSPLLTSSYYLESLIKPHARLDKHILGFLAYWRLEDMKSIHPELLSEINYFSLSISNDGHIKKIVGGETDPGFRNWLRSDVQNLITKAHIFGTEVSVTFTALDNQLISDILKSDSAQKNLIDEIVKEVKDSHLDAVNIDFEYTGEPEVETKEEFTKFSSKLSIALKKQNSKTKLSLSIMPLSVREKGLFDYTKLIHIYDHFIGMSYDYYGATSDIAGPVAPLSGFKDNKYFFDVTSTYADYSTLIPKEKIIMGIAYYGWERAVADGKTINSHTLPELDPNNYSAVISYARARESKDLKNKQCQWDSYAQETWCWFKDVKSGVDHQVWLADNRSIKTRFDYSVKQNLGGIAIWTLGYDKNYPDLWDLLGKTFNK